MQATLVLKEYNKSQMIAVARILNRCADMNATQSIEHTKIVLYGRGRVDFEFTSPISDFPAFVEDFARFGVSLEASSEEKHHQPSEN